MQRVSIATALATSRPIIGMVHLLPLPGSPRRAGAMESVVQRAIEDATTLGAAGFDAVLIENFGDSPFFGSRVPAETIAALAAVIAQLRPAIRLPFGVNVLRNDARAALAIAAATGASFIRVNVHTGAMLTDQGWIGGRAHTTLRMRARLDLQCAILADIGVKHALPPVGHDVRAEARDAWHRGLADALIISGEATGAAPDPERFRRVRSAVPDAPLFAGSGVTPDNVAMMRSLGDGIIVGSAVQADGVAGSAVVAARARAFIECARDPRGEGVRAPDPAFDGTSPSSAS